MTEAAARLPRAPAGWRFVLIAVLVPVALAALAVWLGVEFGRAEALREGARRSADRQIEMVRTLAQLADAETSQRGFVISGDERFLELYAPARRRVDAMIDGLARALAGEGEQAGRLARFRGVATAKFVEMDRVLAARRARGLEAAAAMVAEGQGKRLMDIARTIAAEMVAAEAEQGRERADAFDARTERIRDLLWAAALGVGVVLAAGMWRLWQERQAGYAAALRAHEAAVRQRIIFESTVDAIAILNPSGTIETLNPAALRLLGYDQDALRQRDVSTFFDLPRARGSFYDRIGYADGTLAASYLTDREVKHRDGSVVPVDIALGVMHLPDGDHIIVSMRDIAERKRIERIKDDLLSTVSHELRTPLTSIVGALGLLRTPAAGTLPPAATQLVDIAEANSARLIRLINDMLDIDRIDAGKLKIERTRLDLAALVRRACAASMGLGAGGVTITCAVPDQPVEIDGDADRLLQVIGNLASNAARVSPPGEEVSVTLTVVADEARVMVDDRGPGVPEEFRSRIFGRFERAAGQDTPGTGLGLAISREIVEQHGGTIGFEDREGGGTQFSFTVPLLETSPPDDECDAPPETMPTILHLEDDRDLAAVTAAALEDEARILGARTLEEARAILASERIDLAILDLHLERAKGLDLLPALVDRSGMTIPALLYSAHHVPAEAARRVDATVVKGPGSAGELKSVIRRLLRQARAAA